MERLKATLCSPGDAGIAAAFLAIMLAELAFDDATEGSRWGAVAMFVVIAAALAFRRRLPVSSYAVGTAALTAQALWFFVGGLYPYANLAHLYSVGAFATPRRAILGLLIGFGGVASYFSGADYGFPALPVIVSAIWFLAWATGYRIARLREQTEEDRRRERHEVAALERAAIARELHDLVGHAVNVMVVQAGAGRRILDADPERARQALASIEESGRLALDELECVLSLLRSDEPGELSPQPGLDGLPELFERLRAADFAVEHVVEGRPSRLSPALDLSAFRILQEALTNALKHSDASGATATVRYHDDRVELEVVDRGPPRTDGEDTPGRGLIGIAERVAVFGGHVDHGPTPTGGFGVRATLPRP